MPSSPNNNRHKESQIVDARERAERLDDYMTAHSSKEDDYMARLYRATQTHLLRPRMASGHLQGLLLRMLTQMIKPHIVVEIGTYSGYSALSMAAGMDEGGVIYSFEINDEQEDFTKPWLEGAPYPAKVEMIIGNALDLLPPMDIKADMAFIDGDKRQYANYYTLIMSKLKTGGWLLADNTLWDGHVTDPDYDGDAQTQGIKAFNDLVAADPKAEKVIIPLRDGLTLIRKISD